MNSTHKSHKKHKKQSFKDWLVMQRMPGQIWVSEFEYVENGIVVDIRENVNKVNVGSASVSQASIGSLQHCCDPRYGEDDKKPSRSMCAKEDHEHLLKSEVSMYFNG